MKKLFIGDREVKIGDKVETFRGTPCKVIAIIESHKPSSTGRVYVEFSDGTQGEYFPSVINAFWKFV